MKRRSLFDITSKVEDNKQEEPPKKKRGRPPKQKEPQPVEKSVKTPEKVVEKSVKNTKKTVEKCVSNKNEKPWKSFFDSRPEKLVPCEFYVDKGTDKIEILHGYISPDNCICTDDPYNLIVCRKKYGNLYYREIDGCDSVEKCDNFFPNCENCKKRK